MYQFFYTPQSGKTLGYSRIFVYIIYFFTALQHQHYDFSYAEQLLWQSPWHIDFFISTLPSRESLQWLYYAWLFFLLLSAIGLFGRFSMIMSFLLGYILLGIPVGFLTSNFQFYLPTIILGIFTFSKANDYISVDSFIKFKTINRPDSLSAEYSWPQRLVLFNVVFMYFGAALGKIRHSGIAWATEGAFQYHLITAHNNFKFRLHSESIIFFEWLMSQFWLMPTLGFTVLMLELFSPLAFFFKKTLPYFLLSWICFHIAIALLMGITVSYWFTPAFAVILFSIFSQRITFTSKTSIKKI